jgi:P27 family predicted phage terminase small subunit
MSVYRLVYTPYKDLKISYITGKQAQLLLNITTRQGLYKVVKENNVTVKSQGAGKPNLYLKSDIELVANKTNKQRLKTNPKLKEKTKKTKQKTITKKKVHRKVKEETKKELDIIDDEPADTIEKPNYHDLENPLNSIGQDEFDRIIELLKENGTYKDSDRALVLAYAISYQKYIFAVAASAKQDDTFMDEFGNIKIHPYFTVADRCFTHMDKMAKALGIGVKNRAGIEIKQPKKESIFDIMNTKEKF